jgi:trehalose utilization protein
LTTVNYRGKIADMAIEGEIIPSVQEKSRAALDACKAQCEAVIFWGHSGKKVRSLGDRVQDAVADERRARIREGLTALRMRRIN